MTHEEIENELLRFIQGDEGAQAGVLVLFHPDKRARVVLAIRQKDLDIPAILETIAKQIRDGDGMVLGRDGQTITPTVVCPICKGELHKVIYPSDSMFNRDQFEAAKAGDYYCTTCKGHEARTGYKYWWKSELKGVGDTEMT